MADLNYVYNNVTALFEPSKYPVKRDEYKDMKVPECIQKQFNQLNVFIEDKYQKEFLKVCAFYNKLFVSLKQYDWSRVSYNVVPFTVQDQERSDTGTGLNANYMKIGIDMIVSRLGNTPFDYKLISETPTVQYSIYKDEVERKLRSLVRKNELQRIAVESFHDAAILSFAHAFVDPWSHEIRKLPDWELGFYESEFNEGRLKRVVIRDFAFPISELGPYIKGFPEEKVKEWARKGSSVDLRLYIDCFRHEKYVAVGMDMAEPTPYEFDEVLISTLSWDLGVRKTTVASPFDIVYPLQRAINKLLAKKTQELTMYKGKLSVFSGKETDLIVKNLSNGAGEVLFLDTPRGSVDNMVGEIEPTKITPEISAEVEALKSTIFELLNVQQISVDIENYRSAAAVVALDQMRDAAFQSQLAASAQYIRDIIMMALRYMASTDEEWKEVYELCNDAYIDIKPIQDLKQEPQDVEEPDYMLRHVEKFITDVCKGTKTFDDKDYSYDFNLIKQRAATRLLEYRAIDESADEISRLQMFMIDCFVEDIRMGAVDLALSDEAPPPVPGGLPPLPPL